MGIRRGIYESGVAVTTANLILKTREVRNPVGTPKGEYRYTYFHPLYFTVLGHKYCRNASCRMKKRIKEDREAAAKHTIDDQVDTETK